MFDVYRGDGVSDGQKSLALHIVYQSGNRTLTADDVSKAESGIIKALGRELNATLRT